MVREPLVKATGVAGLVVLFLNALLALSVVMGWWTLTDQQVAAWTLVIDLGVSLAVMTIGIFIARSKVTPNSDPRTNDGKRLVPES